MSDVRTVRATASSGGASRDETQCLLLEGWDATDFVRVVNGRRCVVFPVPDHPGSWGWNVSASTGVFIDSGVSNSPTLAAAKAARRARRA